MIMNSWMGQFSLILKVAHYSPTLSREGGVKGVISLTYFALIKMRKKSLMNVTQTGCFTEA